MTKSWKFTLIEHTKGEEKLLVKGSSCLSLFFLSLTEKAKDAASSVGVGDLEITPVSAAIARHLGIDLTPEGKAARNRRGIAVIVHGTPQSGEF